MVSGASLQQKSQWREGGEETRVVVEDIPTGRRRCISSSNHLFDPKCISVASIEYLLCQTENEIEHLLCQKVLSKNG